MRQGGEGEEEKLEVLYIVCQSHIAKGDTGID